MHFLITTCRSKERERRTKRDTNRRECSKRWCWILEQRPMAAPNEKEEENSGERLNGEERVSSTFRQSLSFRRSSDYTSRRKSRVFWPP